MMREKQTTHGITWLSLQLLRYAMRRRLGLLAVVVTMLVKIGLDVLKPWPMKILVDNVLNGKPLSFGFARWIPLLPESPTRNGLLLWSIGGTVVLFLLGWAL